MLYSFFCLSNDPISIILDRSPTPPINDPTNPAYLTNPSEASFRTYLTELAFRRHLSRLYDAETEHDQSGNTNNADGKRLPAQTKHPSSSSAALHHLPITGPPKKSGSKHFLQNGSSSSTDDNEGEAGLTKPKPLSASDGFHFANRAAIGLRTPGHVFRSLGLCTIAAIPIVNDDDEEGISPVPKKKNNKSDTESSAAHAGGDDKSDPHGDLDDDEVTLAGKWFIGAFGKWWVGGTLQLRQHAVLPSALSSSSSSKVMLEKGDRFTAGVLSFRALDFDPITEGMLPSLRVCVLLSFFPPSFCPSRFSARDGDARSH